MRKSSSSTENKEIHVILECFQNNMPMSSGGAYVAIQISVPNDTLIEDYRISSLKAIGDNGTWEAEKFDFDGFKGKGERIYQNNAREFDVAIGSTNDFDLEIESSSGKRCKYHFEDISVVIVH